VRLRVPGSQDQEAALIFLTEIQGALVVDVHQRTVGHVRDLTVRVQEPYPIVTGLVLSRRRELIIPWSSVRTFAAREVALRVAADSVEKEPADPRDVWLSRDVLDKQVIDLDGRRVVRVNDLQLTESGPHMLLVGADIGIRGILRRLGIENLVKGILARFGNPLPMVLVPWDVVQPVREGDDDAVHLRISGKRIEKLHPADIADIVEELGSRERSAVFESLSEEIAADTLEEMELDDQVSVIEHMDIERASDILEELPPDEVADILAEVPEERAQEILRLMEKEEAEDVEALLKYREDTAGGLMTTEFVAVPDHLTADECIQTLRRLEPEAESIYYVFVVDDEGRLQGVLSLRDLIVAQPSSAIDDIMIRNVVSVGIDTSVEEIAAVLSKYNLLAVPVVDEEHVLRGIVTVDDALEGVLPESVRRRLPRIM
jgi:magnesium transporter